MSLAAFKTAMVTIVNADSAVQAITTRTTLNLLPRGAQALPGANLPMLTYLVVVAPQAGGTSGRRKVTVQIEAWQRTTVDTVIDDLEALIDRVQAVLNGTNFLAQIPPVQVAREGLGARRDGPEEDEVRSIGTDLSFDVTAA